MVERARGVSGKRTVICCADDMSVRLMARQGGVWGVSGASSLRGKFVCAIIVYIQSIILYDSENAFIKEQQLTLRYTP